MTLEELKKEIFSVPQPPYWRKGQFVFNYIDQIYGIARDDLSFVKDPCNQAILKFRLFNLYRK